MTTSPILFSLSFILPLLSGFISLGIIDSVASMVGVKFGSHRWPGSRKTIEGTIGAVAAAIVFGLIFQFSVDYFWPHWVRVSILPFNLLSFFLSTLFCSLFEAFTHQIDNLVMPIFYSLWMFLLL